MKNILHNYINNQEVTERFNNPRITITTRAKSVIWLENVHIMGETREIKKEFRGKKEKRLTRKTMAGNNEGGPETVACVKLEKITDNRNQWKKMANKFKTMSL